jgi:beta-glucosidase
MLSYNYFYATKNATEQMRRAIFLLITAFTFLAASQVQLPNQSPTKPLVLGNEFDDKIAELMAKMTLEEKIGQMTLYTTDWGSTGPTIREGYAKDIRSGQCGILFNAQTAKFTRELQRIAVEESRMKIPLLFGFDVIHGYKTIFPIPLGEAASWDMAAIENAAKVAANESAAAGLHWTFAPMVDISREPRWGRIMEGAGEDTYLGCEIAKARVLGFQGDGFANADRVVACVKHFAGYGAPIAGKDYNTVDMSERTLRQVYLPPYKAAVDAGAMTIMASFNDIDGMPAHGNSWLLQEILRDEWGFEGMVVSDYTGINEMMNHGVIGNEVDATELAVNAGIDMDMQGALYQNHLKKLVDEGKVKMSVIDNAVIRILRIKFELGLFDDPYRFCNEEREKSVLLSAENQAAARDMARKSIVMLKNDTQTLPLTAAYKKIAVIGPLGDDKDNLIGAWSGSGEGKDCISLLTGMRAQAKTGTEITYTKGCEIVGQDRSGFDAAVAAAKNADIVVVAVGENRDMSGEAAARAEITLPGVQEDLVKALIATGKPVVVVLMNGRPLAIPYIADNASAILETWWSGTQAGNAIADILFGAYNPSAKLPITFPRTVGQVPIYYSDKITGRPYNADSKWNSKYLDMPNTPQYPFGFGLSYTTFAYAKPTVDKTTFKQRKDQVTLSVIVENTGKVAGEEIVQFYVRDLVGSVTRPIKELKGYRKIMLKPGEKQAISFTISQSDLAFYTRDMTFMSEVGEFDLMVGPNSANVQAVRVSMTE